MITLSVALAIPHWTNYNVQTCPPNVFLPFTCENHTEITDQSCCFEIYGVTMQTQFWDYNPDNLEIATNGTGTEKHSVDSNRGYFGGKGFYGIGKAWKHMWHKFHIDKTSQMPVEKAFTIHGLWNDRCDGTWDQYCDPLLEVSNEKDNITDIIVNQFNNRKLYDLMSKYWINTLDSNVAGDSSIELWEHEYNKHGTCMNTIKPQCFTHYKTFQSAVEFWTKTTEIWDGLNTYEFLSRVGVVPTVKHQYNKDDIKFGLSASVGFKDVHIGCTEDGVLNEVWYYFHTKGNVLTGQYKHIDALGSDTCPEKIWYLPK